MSDILLSVGLQKGAAETSQLQADLQSIISRLDKNPPKVKVGLTVDQSALNHFKSQLTTIVNSVGLSKGAPITVNISGLGEIGAKAGKAKKALDGVAQSAKTAADAVNNMSGKKASDALTRINNLMMRMQSNLNKWTAAQVGSSSASYEAYSQQLTALSELRTLVEQNAITADEFAERLSNIAAAATGAAAAIRGMGEDHAAASVERLTLGSDAYNTALGETEALLAQVKKRQAEWTAAKSGKSSAAYTELASYERELENLIGKLMSGEMSAEDFAAAFTTIQARVRSAEGAIKSCGENTKTLGDRLKGLAEKFSAWLSVSQVVMQAVRAIKQMVSAVRDIDAAMTELKKVTNETNDVYNNFLSNASKRAKQVGASIADVVNASADFARLGFSLSDASTLADTAIIYKNIGDGIEDVATASESIISTMQAFGIEASNAMRIVDKFNEVGNNFAISSAGIGEAMQRSAAAMAAANNTIDETIALIAAANTIVQNPESVGTTLKTVSMYLRAAKTEAESAGESTEGMASSVSELREEILALTGQKVDIQLDETTFKSTYQILKELSSVWDSISDVSQANLLEMIGGKRNANVVSALLENFSVAERAMKTSAESFGSAMKENEKHLESINGKIELFKAAFQELALSFIGSDFVKNIVDLGTTLIGVLNTVTKIVSAFGGLNTVLYTTLSIIVTIKAQAIVTGIMSFFTAIATGLVNFGATLVKIGSALKVFIAMTKASRNASAGAMMIYGQSTGILGRLAAAFNAVGISASTAQIAVGAFMIVITALVLVLQSLKKAQEEAEQKAEETRQRNIQAAQSAATLSDEISTLINRYVELNDVTGVNSSNVEQLIATKSELITKLQLEQDELDALIKKYGSYSDAIKQASIDKLRDAERDLRGGLNAREEELINKAKVKYIPIGMGVSGTMADNSLISITHGILSKALSTDSAEQKAINALDASGLFRAWGQNKAWGFGIEGMTADDLNNVEGILDAYDKLGQALDLVEEKVGSNNEVYSQLYAQYSAVTEAINNYKGAIGNLNTNLAEQYMLDGLIGQEIPRTQEEYDAYRQKIIDAAVASGEFIGSNKDIAVAIDNVLAQQPQFMKFCEDYEEATGSATTATNKFVSALAKINALNTGLSELDKVYADILDGGDFDWSLILDNEVFTNAFSGLGDAYADFMETVANSPDDIEACQGAFDNLVAAYLRNSSALRSVTDETRDATVAMLEQMGVANAAAIVDAQLAYNKEYLKYTTGDFATMTYEEIFALYSEADAGSVAQQVLAELALAKMLANENAVQTASDIDQIIALANAANATVQSLANLSKAKQLFAQADAAFTASETARQNYINGGDHGNWQALFAQASSLRQQAEELLAAPIEYDRIDPDAFKSSYTGGSATQSARDAASKSSSKEETWFEKQLAEHQHLVAMEKETEAEYLAWLSSAYPKAYQEGIIELKDFYKYQEEVFAGLRDVFRDTLGDIEHEIEMRSNYSGEGKKIIELYETLIDKVEKEIASARAQGLTDEDEYMQELQSMWQDYTNSIKEMREDATSAAKDALDELVDFRIDMLKQEIEDEKDALDKRLDNLKEFYDKQKEMLQDQRDEENYLKDQSDKRKTVADLQAELAMLANDDSAWAQKRKLELQEELATAQEDLDEFEKDHALDLALDAIDKAYNDQESQLQAEMDALDERLNDPEALFNKALEDIRKNSENQLYYQMLMYNKQFGDGNDETVKELWESAFGALSDYEKLFGELYNGVKLDNATGVEDEGGWDDEEISGTNPDNQQTTPPPADNTAKEEPAAPQLTDDIKKKVAAAIWNGGYGWGTGSTRTQRLTEVFGANNGIQALVNKGVGRTGVSLTNEYTYANMRKKFKGYAQGTANAIPGLHEVDEFGAEYLFVSPSDGSKYRMFHGGEKVLTADETDFLYNFAASGGGILAKMLSGLLGISSFGNVSRPVQAIEINAGDIIVRGDASSKTVSEIRRAQRDNLQFILKSLNDLNK